MARVSIANEHAIILTEEMLLVDVPLLFNFPAILLCAQYYPRVISDVESHCEPCP